MRRRRMLVVILGTLSCLLLAGTALAASRTNAVWVHGNVAGPESPGALQSISLRGWGIFFEGKENTFNWIHIGVATPVITEDTRVNLWKIFVRFKTVGDVKITNIHVWDGAKRVWLKDGLSLSGDHLSLTEWGINSFVVDNDPATAPNIAMGTGIDIVVGVTFGLKDPATSKLPVIQFSTAGADFYRSW